MSQEHHIIPRDVFEDRLFKVCLKIDGSFINRRDCKYLCDYLDCSSDNLIELPGNEREARQWRAYLYHSGSHDKYTETVRASIPGGSLASYAAQKQISGIINHFRQQIDRFLRGGCSSDGVICNLDGYKFTCYFTAYDSAISRYDDEIDDQDGDSDSAPSPYSGNLQWSDAYLYY